MATSGDVQNVLAGLIASALYPNGTAQPSAVGFNVRVGAGWPNAIALDADLAQGIANISIYATAQERNTTRYPERWQVSTQYAPTVTLSVIGMSITVGGTLPATYFTQNLAVFVANVPYTYTVQPSDTLATIASALASLIAQAWPGTTNAGTVITLPADAPLGVLRTGGTGTGVQVVRNQQRTFQITLWAASPAQRNALQNALDALFAPLRFVVMPDGVNARIVYMDSPQQDLGEKARLYRCDVRYSVDFATTVVQNAPQVIVGDLNIVTETQTVLKPV